MHVAREYNVLAGVVFLQGNQTSLLNFAAVNHLEEREGCSVSREGCSVSRAHG